eukprot:TCONS_00026120-protein
MAVFEKSTCQFFIIFLLLTGTTASNILRLKEVNNGNFILKEEDKKHATAPYKTFTVQDTVHCMDKCTDDTGCKSVNVDENQSPLECQLVANDRNDVDSYVDATGFKHYDTGETKLSTFVNPNFPGCIVPRSHNCLKIDSQDDLVFMSEVDTHCNRLYAYFHFDVETGRLFHHCTGVPVCLVSSRLVISFNCPTSNKESGSSYANAFRRTFQGYLSLGGYSFYLESSDGSSGQLIKSTSTSAGGTQNHRVFNFPTLVNGKYSTTSPKKVRVRVYASSTSSLNSILLTIASSPTNYIYTGYSDDFAHTTNSWNNVAYVHAANFIAPITGYYHFALTCTPYCALFHGNTESTKVDIFHNIDAAGTFMSPSRAAEYGPGLYMEKDKTYFLETVLLDTTTFEFIGLMMLLPGIDDEWKPVSDKYLQKI